RSLKPSRVLVPYSVNVPFWSDGASKRRWLMLPTGASLTLTSDQRFAFPTGTIAVKHFEYEGTGQDSPYQRLETRLLVYERDGRVHGASYRWRPDGADADLVLG